MQREENWLRWAVELQSLAQAGLAYGKDVYDLERYTRIREIAAEMLVEPSGLPLERVKDLFCRETGYQTPKLDSRAAIFRDGKVLLVQENDGRWSLPGGWVEVDLSVGENTVKEPRRRPGWTWSRSGSSPCRTGPGTISLCTPTACARSCSVHAPGRAV